MSELRERMIRAAFDAFYAEGTPYNDIEQAMFGQVVDAVVREMRAGGSPLESARLRTGWSVREAARQSGVSASMISRLERSEGMPTLGLARKLATAYGVSVDDLWPETVEVQP